jgi:hypothetical protein
MADKTINIDIKVNAPTLKELRANLSELENDVKNATSTTAIKKFEKEIDNLNKSILCKVTALLNHEVFESDI